MVPDEVRRLYQADYDDLERLAERVGDIVTGYCLETGFAMASRPGHVKTLKSSAEKLETGRYARWSDLEDLVAFSIIIPTRVSEVGVLEFLRTKFSESKTKSQNDLEQDPSIFRFGATRFIGHLKSAVPDNEPLLALPFEIQVRTAFEHAWSVTTRALAYKPDEIDWRFERIAAQLKASVEQLDMLVVAYKENAGLLSPQTFQPIEDQRRILEHFKQCLANNRIPPEGAPSQWGLFAKNVHARMALELS
jgi:ppGpp synthetase/RelA/SpoT-type nucleotidyltranferase